MIERDTMDVFPHKAGKAKNRISFLSSDFQKGFARLLGRIRRRQRVGVVSISES